MNINDRLIVEQNKAELVITLLPFVEEKKITLLKLWTFFWTLCGLAVASQFFFDYAPKEKVFFAIYLSLWLYFEIKVIHALRWRLYGEEQIKITQSGFFEYTELIGKRGLPMTYPLAEISDFEYLSKDEGSFFTLINNAVWMIGAECIGYKVNGTTKQLGRELTKVEAEKLIQKIIKAQNSYVKAIKN